MVKTISLILCVLVTLVVATSSLLAYPLGAATIHLSAVPESWSLMLLGSVLISGATVLRRRWSAPGK